MRELLGYTGMVAGTPGCGCLRILFERPGRAIAGKRSCLAIRQDPIPGIGRRRGLDRHHQAIITIGKATGHGLRPPGIVETTVIGLFRRRLATSNHTGHQERLNAWIKRRNGSWSGEHARLWWCCG